MTAERARIAAEAYLSDWGSGGWTCAFERAHKTHPSAEEWSVIFNVYEPGGTLVDTSLIIVVNEVTGKVWQFPT